MLLQGFSPFSDSKISIELAKNSQIHLKHRIFLFHRGNLTCLYHISAVT